MNDGVINVYKERGMTSHDVVFKLRKILQTKKVGHCGTLDPEVDGVLVVTVNKGCKINQYLTLDTKEYVCTMKLGIATTTQDLTGEVVETKAYQNDLSQKQVISALNKFTGKIIQTPSIYSAIKVNGKKLYEYARAGQQVEIPSREIEIFELELLDFKDDEISFRCLCSKGTYIRSLCFDLGAYLGYPSTMKQLTRTKSGSFNIEDAYSLERIANNDYSLVAVSDALSFMPTFIANEQDKTRVIHGKTLFIKDLDKVFVKDDQNNPLAIYVRKNENEMKSERGLF